MVVQREDGYLQVSLDSLHVLPAAMVQNSGVLSTLMRLCGSSVLPVTPAQFFAHLQSYTTAENVASGAAQLECLLAANALRDDATAGTALNHAANHMLGRQVDRDDAFQDAADKLPRHLQRHLCQEVLRRVPPATALQCAPAPLTREMRRLVDLQPDKYADG